MPIEGEYEPSAWGWVAKQVDQYESSGGTTGVTLQGVPTVVMTMHGRKSGKVRKAAVMRIEHDGAYAAVASKGGDPNHPGWYLNLLADPEVTVQFVNRAEPDKCLTATFTAAGRELPHRFAAKF